MRKILKCVLDLRARFQDHLQIPAHQRLDISRIVEVRYPAAVTARILRRTSESRDVVDTDVSLSKLLGRVINYGRRQKEDIGTFSRLIHSNVPIVASSQVDTLLSNKYIGWITRYTRSALRSPCSPEKNLHDSRIYFCVEESAASVSPKDQVLKDLIDIYDINPKDAIVGAKQSLVVSSSEHRHRHRSEVCAFTAAAYDARRRWIHFLMCWSSTATFISRQLPYGSCCKPK